MTYKMKVSCSWSEAACSGSTAACGWFLYSLTLGHRLKESAFPMTEGKNAEGQTKSQEHVLTHLPTFCWSKQATWPDLMSMEGGEEMQLLSDNNTIYLTRPMSGLCYSSFRWSLKCMGSWKRRDANVVRGKEMFNMQPLKTQIPFSSPLSSSFP